MSTTTAGSSSTVDFILPDLGEGVHEAEIVSWKVKVGDTVDEMDVLAEMETDKALVEVPSPFAGKVVALYGKEGDIVHVGKPIVTYENATQGGEPVTNGEKAAAAAIGAGDTQAIGSKPHTAETMPKWKDDDENEQSSEGEREDAGTVVGSMDSQPKLGGGDGKVMATPAVRRLAKELGIDINSLAGSGRGGRVTASDVQQAAKAGGGGGRGGAGATTARQTQPQKRAPQRAAEPAFAPVKVDAQGISERIPFRGVRRKIAESLDRSVKTAVHFTVMDTADVTQLDKLRKQQSGASGEKISFLPFIVQAVCRALKKLPQLNANVDDENSEILIKGVINMGIAVDTDHGLMVPVIENADRLGILPLSREIASLADQCRSRMISLERLRGGTFTISNVGSYGGAFATPILNYPEVGILGVGRAREAVMARNGGIFVGLEMPLSMSCDHRVVDGVYGAMLLNEVVQLLENPEILLEPAGR